jgi:hypothetical protein
MTDRPDWDYWYRRWCAELDASYQNFAHEHKLKYNTLRREFAARGGISGREQSSGHTHISQIIPTDAESLDTERWQIALNVALAQPFTRISHAADLHFPYHDEAALDLYLICVMKYQPDIIVVGSDAFDFPSISTFAPNPDLTDDDALETVRPYWQDFIGRLRKAAPAATLVFIMGNHEQRLWRFVCNQAPQVRKTLMRAFVDLVRQGGEVLWLGMTGQVDIGSLTVAHGSKKLSTLRKYGAFNQLDKLRYQRHISAGHAHRLQSATIRGPEHIVESAISGCLCRLTPHYNISNEYSDWVQGSAFWTVHNASDIAWQHNLKFDTIGHRLYTMLGGEILSVTKGNDLNRLEVTPLTSSSLAVA